MTFQTAKFSLALLVRIIVTCQEQRCTGSPEKLLTIQEVWNSPSCGKEKIRDRYNHNRKCEYNNNNNTIIITIIIIIMSLYHLHYFSS
jgi:hypothetical protein